MASAPGFVLLFKEMQDQKNKAAQDQFDILRRANAEMERQTRLINEYAASQERLIAAGGAMPEMPSEEPRKDDSAGTSASPPVDSDPSVTSLADAAS